LSAAIAPASFDLPFHPSRAAGEEWGGSDNINKAAAVKPERIVMAELPAVTNIQDKVTEYVPFGAQDKVRLTVNAIKSLVAVKTKTKQTCSDRDAIRFIAMCQARRLNPFEGDAYLIGYDTKDGAQFSLITAHQAFLKRAELHAEYDGMKSGIIIRRDGGVIELEGDFYLEGDEVLGGWATVYFKNRKQPMQKRVRLKRFFKPFGVWIDDAAGMICKCAEADALRSSFPTMLGGLYLREEISTEPGIQAVKPVFDSPSAPPQLFASPTDMGVSEAEAKPDAKQEAKPGKPSSKAGEANLGELREAMSAAGVTESDLTDYLHNLGSLGGNVTTLEELALSAGSVLAMVWEQRAQLLPQVKEWSDSL
jgi:phage recombination protein Bet